MRRLFLQADEIDLNQRVLHEEAGAANGGARRRHLEIALPHRIKAVEIVQVGKEYLRLQHVLERGARGFEGFFEVLQDIRRLQLDIGAVIREALMLARFAGHAAFEIACELPSSKYEIAD